jgi:hypothetical protein
VERRTAAGDTKMRVELAEASRPKDRFTGWTNISNSMVTKVIVCSHLSATHSFCSAHPAVITHTICCNIPLIPTKYCFKNCLFITTFRPTWPPAGNTQYSIWDDDSDIKYYKEKQNLILT